MTRVTPTLRALVELTSLVRDTRSQLVELDAAELDALAKDPAFVEAFEARLRTQVLAGLDGEPAQLAELEHAVAPLRELGRARTFDRFAHWSRHAMLERLLHALELGFDELRYAGAAQRHEGACDCAIVRTLVAHRRKPASDRLRCVDVDDADSVLLRERWVCDHCGCVWERCSSSYPGDAIGGDTWALA